MCLIIEAPSPNQAIGYAQAALSTVASKKRPIISQSPSFLHSTLPSHPTLPANRTSAGQPSLSTSFTLANRLLRIYALTVEVAPSICHLCSPGPGFYKAAGSLKHILNMWNIFAYTYTPRAFYEFLIGKFQYRYLAAGNGESRASIIQRPKGEITSHGAGQPRYCIGF